MRTAKSNDLRTVSHDERRGHEGCHGCGDQRATVTHLEPIILEPVVTKSRSTPPQGNCTRKVLVPQGYPLKKVADLIVIYFISPKQSTNLQANLRIVQLAKRLASNRKVVGSSEPDFFGFFFYFQRKSTCVLGDLVVIWWGQQRMQISLWTRISRRKGDTLTRTFLEQESTSSHNTVSIGRKRTSSWSTVWFQGCSFFVQIIFIQSN